MIHDDFENQLKRTPMREIPSDWRAQIVENAAAFVPVNETSRTEPKKGRWLDLLWPCPQAWAALACVWIGILLFNAGGEPERPVQTASHADPEVLMARLAQQRLLSENKGLF